MYKVVCRSEFKVSFWYSTTWLQEDLHSTGRLFSQKGKAAFEIEIIFLRISCVRKHNAQTVDQQNELPQGKQRRQIVNNFQYQPYISKELLIFLFYGHTWEALQTCQILALGTHTDASVSSPTEHSLPLSRLLACIVLKGWVPPNRIQYSDWIDGLSPEKLC